MSKKVSIRNGKLVGWKVAPRYLDQDLKLCICQVKQERPGNDHHQSCPWYANAQMKLFKVNGHEEQGTFSFPRKRDHYPLMAKLTFVFTDTKDGVVSMIVLTPKR